MEENNNENVVEPKKEEGTLQGAENSAVNHSIPAAGETISFEEMRNADASQPETSQNDIPQVETPQVETPQVETPQVEAPQYNSIPQVETPQQQNYQQTPPPIYTEQQQNYQQTPPPVYTEQQQNYQQTPPTETYQYQYAQSAPAEPDITPMTMGDWIVTSLLLMIPCVNIILLFVWAFGDKTGNLNRKNYAKANLVLMAIVLALYLFVIIVMAVIAAVGFSAAY